MSLPKENFGKSDFLKDYLKSVRKALLVISVSHIILTAHPREPFFDFMFSNVFQWILVLIAFVHERPKEKSTRSENVRVETNVGKKEKIN